MHSANRTSISASVIEQDSSAFWQVVHDKMQNTNDADKRGRPRSVDGPYHCVTLLVYALNPIKYICVYDAYTTSVYLIRTYMHSETSEYFKDFMRWPRMIVAR